MQETFKDIKGYEGIYQVSNLGRVKSLKRKNRRTEKILTNSLNCRGYYLVVLYKNSIQKSKSIHRLVLSAFIINPENKRTVNHIDGNKLNNNVLNLEWNTHSENIKHAFSIGIKERTNYRLGKTGYDCPNSKIVLQYDKNNKFIKEFGSGAEAERGTSISQGNISSVCLNKKGFKTAGGYKWKYKN